MFYMVGRPTGHSTLVEGAPNVWHLAESASITGQCRIIVTACGLRLPQDIRRGHVPRLLLPGYIICDECRMTNYYHNTIAARDR